MEFPLYYLVGRESDVYNDSGGEVFIGAQGQHPSNKDFKCSQNVCRGVLNRDMKPENLLLKRKHTCQDARCTMENLRCVDFGSAAVLENGGAPVDPPRLYHVVHQVDICVA